MSLYLFLLVIVSLLCGSAPAMAEPSPRSVLASVIMVSGWVLLAHIGARLMARHVVAGKLSFGDAVDYLRMQMETFRWFALPITLICHYGFSMAAWMRLQPVLEDSMFLQAIVLLSPGMTLLAATWSAEYCFAAIIGTQPATFSKYFGSLVQMARGGPAWLVFPTLVFLGLGDLGGLIQNAYFVDAQGLSTLSENWVWGLLGVGVSLVAVALPWIVRWVAKTETLAEPDRSELTRWLENCGISTRPIWGMQVARWNTGARQLNAMVAGVVRPGRLLLLSDRLLDELPRGQRLMVVMHELAHVRRFHVPLRMAAILPAWFVSAWMTRGLVEYGAFGTDVSATVGGLLGLVTTVVSLGAVSHFCELDADATACRLAVRACGELASDTPSSEKMTHAMAAELMADALVRVTADHASSRKASWLHPSLATRTQRLRRISRPLPDPQAGRHTLVA